MVQITSYTIIPTYFPNRASLASSLLSVGNVMGQIATPFLIKYLINTFGFTGANLLLAAIFLNGCAAGICLRKARETGTNHQSDVEAQPEMGTKRNSLGKNINDVSKISSKGNNENHLSKSELNDYEKNISDLNEINPNELKNNIDDLQKNPLGNLRMNIMNTANIPQNDKNGIYNINDATNIGMRDLKKMFHNAAKVALNDLDRKINNVPTNALNNLDRNINYVPKSVEPICSIEKLAASLRSMEADAPKTNAPKNPPKTDASKTAAPKRYTDSATNMPHPKAATQAPRVEINGKQVDQTDAKEARKHTNTEKTCTTKNLIQIDENGNVSNINPKIDHFVFAAILLAMFCFIKTNSSTSTLLIPLIEDQGLSSHRDLILSVKSLARASLLVPIGFVLAKPNIRPYIEQSFCGILIFNGISTMLIGLFQGKVIFMILIGLNSLVNESVYCQLTIFLIQVFGLQQMPLRYGITCGCMGTSYIVWPLIVGKY